MNKLLNQWINNLYRRGAIDVDQRDDLKDRLNVQCEDIDTIIADMDRYIKYMPASYQKKWTALRGGKGRVMEQEIAKLRSLLDEARNAIGWYVSFSYDVAATAPEYFENCGDLNACMYLLNEAQVIQEQIDLVLDQRTAEGGA